MNIPDPEPFKTKLARIEEIMLMSELASGRWVSALVNADDVVLLSWTAAGLQDLLLQHACLLLELGAHHQPFKDDVCCLQWQQL